MHKWIVNIKYPDREETIISVERPLVQTAGVGDKIMLRIAHLGGESWLPFPATAIDVNQISERGLMEVLKEKDLALIESRAQDIRNSGNVDDVVVGDVILEALRYYRECGVVLEQSQEVALDGTASS